MVYLESATSDNMFLWKTNPMDIARQPLNKKTNPVANPNEANLDCSG
jgi:hypothetical protein